MRRAHSMLLAVAALLWMVLPATALAERAEDLYRTYCVQCHGMTGKGNGINVRDMSVQPRDHTDSMEMAGLSDERLFKAIKEGGPAVTKSVLMPPWGAVLSDEDIKGLVRYLRVLCNCKGRS
ncbi:MAG: c-type cytochrome [Leptospirillia bacterium]